MCQSGGAKASALRRLGGQALQLLSHVANVFRIDNNRGVPHHFSQ
jgi:hypothetical protein